MKDKDIKLCSSYFWLVEANFQKYYTSSVYNNVEFLHLVSGSEINFLIWAPTDEQV